MSATVMPTASTARTRLAGCASSPRPADRASTATRMRIPTTIGDRVGTMALADSPMALAEALEQVIAHPQGVRHHGEGGVHRAAGREEARVHDVEVVHLVSLAMLVQRRRSRVSAEPDRPVLVGDPGERNALAEVEVPGEEPLVALVAVKGAAGLLLHEVLQ